MFPVFDNTEGHWYEGTLKPKDHNTQSLHILNKDYNVLFGVCAHSDTRVGIPLVILRSDQHQEAWIVSASNFRRAASLLTTIPWPIHIIRVSDEAKPAVLIPRVGCEFRVVCTVTHYQIGDDDTASAEIVINIRPNDPKFEHEGIILTSRG